MNKKNFPTAPFAIAISALLLASCGGGGGGSGAASGSLVITGVAATGAAISGGAVSAKCTSGTGTGTTNADGTYSLSVSGGVQPCVLRAIEPVSNQAFYSVLESGQTVANVTPLTTLVAANVLGEDPTAVYANASNQSFSKITSSTLATAREVVIEISKILGSEADLTGFDPLKDTLVAKTSTVDGNDLDKKIDILMAALQANNKAISDLVTLVKASNDKQVIAQQVEGAVISTVSPTLAFRDKWNEFLLDTRSSVTYSGTYTVTNTVTDASRSGDYSIGFDKTANASFTKPGINVGGAGVTNGLVRFDITAISNVSSATTQWFVDSDSNLVGIVDEDGLKLVPETNKTLPENIAVGMSGTYYKGILETDLSVECGTQLVTWSVRTLSTTELMFVMHFDTEQSKSDYFSTYHCGAAFKSRSNYFYRVAADSFSLVKIESTLEDSDASLEFNFEVATVSASVPTTNVSISGSLDVSLSR